MNAFLLGVLCGASLLGAYAMARIGELQRAHARSIDQLKLQIQNTLDLAASIEAQADRERYQRQLADVEWNELFAPLFEGEAK